MPLTILFYSLAAGFLVLVGFACYALYHLAQTLKAVKRMVENLHEITRDIQVAENTVKNTVLNGLVRVLSIFGPRKKE